MKHQLNNQIQMDERGRLESRIYAIVYNGSRMPVFPSEELVFRICFLRRKRNPGEKEKKNFDLVIVIGSVILSL